MRYWLVMPAAGVGRRFGTNTPKQYATVHGRSVIEWALAPFLSDSRCVGVVAVLAESDPYWARIAPRLPATGAATEGRPSRPKLTTVTGGSERSHSVRNGLSALAGRALAEDWVLVHDAARPCLRAQDLTRLLEVAGAHPVGGVLASRAADTLKRAGAGNEVLETVDRSGLWRAQTPQMFRYGPLCEALNQALSAGRLPTDEAQALEWAGYRPLVVEGSPGNIKITSAEDLAVANALLLARATEGAAP